MIFSKKMAVAICICFALNACSQLPIQKNTPSKTEEPDQTDATLENAEATPEQVFVKVPRPLPTGSVSVPSQARDEFSKAKQAMLKKQWKEAESILLLMSNTYPKLAGVYTNLGIVYSKMNELEKAENAYEFALQTNPLNFDAYTNLGVVLREQGKFDEAESNYQQALTHWPHHQPSLLNLGILYDMYLGKPVEALDYYKLAQKLNDEEDRKLKGWIIDLQRRLPKPANGTD
jgi:tetratricopeptide (TPR) repeat protein